MKLEVRPIPIYLARPWILDRHYAHRMPAVSHIFGLFTDVLAGVCTFGPPARQLNNGKGIFGGKLETSTFELNRLVVADQLPKNALSRFVSGALKQLPAPCCVVSYADANQGHHGYIYQATNWCYTGLTTPELEYISPDGVAIHPRTVVDLFGTRSVADLPSGWDVVRTSGKHRYVMFVGSKTERRQMQRALVYETRPYPKGLNDRYEAQTVGAQMTLQVETPP